LSNNNGSDKRRYLRYEILDYAQVYCADKTDATNCVIVDIGLGGLQVRTKQALPVGELCAIQVGRMDKPPLMLKGEVRHCGLLDDSDLYATGVRFMPQTHMDRMAIAEYVHEVFQRQCDKLLA
jgi:hypothetical protein